ncbi:MAG: TerB family tellurite resistance protein [Candidatus Obscuribacterales bacterium]|nr:TerB family tellurite resistance protein [Candidatus Obscuribacterales bacterium]
MAFTWFNDLTSSLKTGYAQFNNKNFKNAAMATCALVAAADGTIDPSEKTKVAALIAKNELLQAFKATELRDQFLAYCDDATDEFARLDLLNVVAKLRAYPDQADTAVKIALIIANADGNFSDDEKVVVKEICQKLGLPFANYVS